MSSWLLSITGVIFLGVLFDLIYPNGKTNTLCKTIFGVVAVVVMITPILNIDLDKLTLGGSVNQQLINNLEEAKIQSIKTRVDTHLKSCGISGVIVKIDIILSEDKFYIDKIYLDTTNLVLTENVTNINKYEVIANEISKVVDVDKERIIVYG